MIRWLVKGQGILLCSMFVAFTLNRGLLADTLYESASLGATGITYPEGPIPWDGHVIDTFVYTGVVFELPKPAETTRIGGHFVRRQIATSDFFGAIVKLTGPNDLPDSDDFSTPDVLGTALLNFPATSGEVFGNLSLSLNQGWYALVFASGHFGTFGKGATVITGTDYGSPRYIARVYDPIPFYRQWFYASNDFDGQRLVVEGQFVPEPISWTLLLAGFLALVASWRYRLPMQFG